MDRVLIKVDCFLYPLPFAVSCTEGEADGSPSSRACAFGGARRGVRETTRKGTGTGPGATRSRELKGKRK